MVGCCIALRGPQRGYIEHLFHVKRYVNQKPLGPSTGFQRLLIIDVGGDGGTFVFFLQSLVRFFCSFAPMLAVLVDRPRGSFLSNTPSQIDARLAILMGWFPMHPTLSVGRCLPSCS